MDHCNRDYTERFVWCSYKLTNRSEKFLAHRDERSSFKQCNCLLKKPWRILVKFNFFIPWLEVLCHWSARLCVTVSGTETPAGDLVDLNGTLEKSDAEDVITGPEAESVSVVSTLPLSFFFNFIFKLCQDWTHLYAGIRVLEYPEVCGTYHVTHTWF